MDRNGPVRIISPYRGCSQTLMHTRGSSALQWYTSRLVHELRHYRNVGVIAQRSDTREPWSDDGINVAPSFDRGDVAVALQIASAVRGNPGSVIHLQHELFAYGGALSAFTLPHALRAVRYATRAIVTTVHGVIPLDAIDATFVRSNAIRLQPRVVRPAWRALIRSVCAASDIVHVHEIEHRQILISQYGVTTPIECQPIGIDAPPSIDAVAARMRFDIDSRAHVVLFFGFLVERKGIVPLLESLEAMLANDPDLVVVIAGSMPERVAQNERLLTLLEKHSTNPRVVQLGFVADEDVEFIFAACDVLILPYTIAIAASGPMSIALGHGKPILFSTVFAPSYPDAIGFFEPTTTGITRAVATFFLSESLQRTLVEQSRSLASRRTWHDVAAWCDQLYDRATDFRARTST